MPACPNCGRQTLRTKDWACQWCGYPLLSRAYKKIDKTFKELQAERSGAVKASPSPEPEPDFDLDSELDLTSESPPAPEPAPEATPKYKIAPEPAPKPEVPSGPLPEIPPKPDKKRKPKLARKPKSESEPEPIPEPQPEITPPPVSTPATSQQTAPQLAPPPVPKPLPEPEPAPVAAPNLETITDGMLLSVDELDALFKANRQGVHAKLTNKIIMIKGFIEKVFIRDHIDVRYIMLTGVQKKLLWPVRCSFGKEIITQMNRLGEGQAVVIRGKYDSYGKNIIFKDCALIN